jgi:hypothetical protein
MADAIIERSENIELISAELRKKKRANQSKDKSYQFAGVLNQETVQEWEAYCVFEEHWRLISRCQPNLLGFKKKKKLTKKTGSQKSNHRRLTLQLSPKS